MKTRLSRLILTLAIAAATHVASAQLPALRGLYINSFSSILGNEIKEDSLLHYAQDSSFNYLALYNLSSLNFSSSADMNKLATFISKARTNFGMQYIGAVGENYSFFSTKIKSYNDGRINSIEKFNVFNLEFEFWVPNEVNAGGVYCVNYLLQAGCSCDTSGGFKYYIQTLHQMDSLAGTMGVISETYVGWFNQGQGSQIQRNVDRILLHAYRVDPTSVFGYSKSRLGYLASNNQPVNVAPIFSAEPAYMGPWLSASHGQIEAYNKYVTDFNADNSSWKQYINIQGYQWFAQSYMPKPAPDTGFTFDPLLFASDTTSFCIGGSVTLTVTSGDSYLWSNGATTQSIVIAATGDFTCDVTINGTTKTTPSKSVTVFNQPTAAVVVSAPDITTVPLQASALAGSGTIVSYQWKMNGADISGATQANFVADSSAAYSFAVSNSNGCGVVSPEQLVEMPEPPSPTCTLTIPTGTYSAIPSPSSIALFWDSLPTSDSIIVRYTLEGSGIYTYVQMPNVGQTSLTLRGLQSGIEYSWRVKTVCGTNSSDYSEKLYFTLSNMDQTQIHSDGRLSYSYTITTDILDNIDLNVYPNPATENFHMYFNMDNEQNASIQLTDLTGRVVKTEEVHAIEGENLASMNVSNLPEGIYIAALKFQENIFYKKILVQ